MERTFEAGYAVRVTPAELKAIGRELRWKSDDPIKQERRIIPFNELPPQYRIVKDSKSFREIDVGDIIAPVYLDDCDGMPSEAWEIKVGDRGKYLERTPEALSKARELRSQTEFTCINQFLK